MKETQEKIGKRREAKTMKQENFTNSKEQKYKMKKVFKNEIGITLIALVVTIVVLLILAGITINLLFSNGGIFKTAEDAADAWNKATINEQESLDNIADQIANLVNGTHSGETDDGKFAMFDTGTNVANKIRTLVADGNIGDGSAICNLSIDGIKKYTGTPDVSSMTDANIVSSTELYELYQQNPEMFEGIVPEGAELYPIYMWFEESGNTEMRNMVGTSDDMSASGMGKEVPTGTLYWWCETSNVYLNMDSSRMFAGLPYLSDISGLQNIKTNYTTNLSQMFFDLNKLRLTNVNALSNWDTSAVTDMSSLFYGCSGLTDLSGLQNWNTSAVTNMSCMFYGGDSAMVGITDLNSLATWDVTNVTDMSSMFQMCINLSNTSGIDNWNIVNVTNFGDMFNSCPTHPNFTKVTGTWDENGTFIPD